MSILKKVVKSGLKRKFVPFQFMRRQKVWVEKGELDEGRYDSFLNLEDEIAKLQKRAKKRQMAVERWAKRSHRVKARNLEDRIQLEKDERGEI